MTERGALGKWGANFAADPMVTRINERGNLDLIVIRLLSARCTEGI